MQSFARRVCVCVRQRERQGHSTAFCVCVWERERHGHISAACVQTHTSFNTVSVTWLCFPFGLELMVKLRTLLTVFTFILKAEAHDYGKVRYVSDSCLCCSTNHNAQGQPAIQSYLFGRRDFVGNEREAGHRGPSIMYSIWKMWVFFIKACQHILLHQIHKIITFKKASYDSFNVLICKCP